jgi:hypothetical protein
MHEPDRARIRQLYDLQFKLFESQGDEIAALRQANESLQRSHEIIGEMLRVTGELLSGDDREG